MPTLAEFGPEAVMLAVLTHNTTGEYFWRALLQKIEFHKIDLIERLTDLFVIFR